MKFGYNRLSGVMTEDDDVQRTDAGACLSYKLPQGHW